MKGELIVVKKKNSFSAIVLAIGVILLAVGAFLNFNGNKNKNDDKKNYKLSNDDIVNSKFVPIIRLDFTNTKVNKGISDDVFEIKDNRIFGDDE